MAIFLRPPEVKPGGPDGKGWNRLSLNAHMGTPSPQCALRPRSAAALYESWHTTRARWGGFGRCAGDPAGECTLCPVFLALDNPKYLAADTDKVLVRLKQANAPEGGWGMLGAPAPTPYVVDEPELGWASPRYRWRWEDLARLVGWHLAGTLADHDGEGFWLAKDNPNLLHGTAREEAGK